MAEKVRFGIFPKVLLFALCISLIPIAGIVVVAYLNMTSIGNLVLGQGKRSLEELGARVIENKARDVAAQLEVYVQAHPTKTVKDLQQDPRVQTLAVQPVGETGYTAVQDAHTAINLFHKDPKIVNMDLHQLAPKLPEFWKIMERSLGGKESSGYYEWTEPDGKIRKKYMFITALKTRTADNVQMGVAATTYLDEFSKPVIELEQRVSGLIRERLVVFFVLIAVTALVVLLTSFSLARTITKPILYLVEVTDQISKGKLGTKIEISRKDEIGLLIESTKRMQRSLALAIRKLQERSGAAKG
ncbi:MAG: HAMP domain-containing protein [Thermodesulfobacteriota bacterium]